MVPYMVPYMALYEVLYMVLYTLHYLVILDVLPPQRLMNQKVYKQTQLYHNI